MESYKIPFLELALTKKDIFCEMGYKRVLPEQYLIDILDELYSIVQKEIIAEYTLKIFDAEVFETSMRIGNEIILETGNTISSLMKGSVSIALFAATAGNRFEELIHEVKGEGDIVKIYMLDIIGSCIAEKTGDLLEVQLETKIQGSKHTHRFSPGYCGWLLTEQRKIFSLLGENTCGIKLSDVCLMNPIKSISGIIGIGEHVSQKLYGCSVCDLESCYKRKQKKYINETIN